MPTHLTFTTELIDTVAHFTRMLRRHKSDGFIQNRHSKTFMAAKNPRKLRLSKKNMGKRWVKTDTEIICHIQDKRKGRKDSYLRGSVSHRKFLLSHKPSKAIVFILIKHGVFDCKVHKQKRHEKGGSFWMVMIWWFEISAEPKLTNKPTISEENITKKRLLRWKAERGKKKASWPLRLEAFSHWLKEGGYLLSR